MLLHHSYWDIFNMFAQGVLGAAAVNAATGSAAALQKSGELFNAPQEVSVWGRAGPPACMADGLCACLQGRAHVLADMTRQSLTYTHTVAPDTPGPSGCQCCCCTTSTCCFPLTPTTDPPHHW